MCSRECSLNLKIQSFWPLRLLPTPNPAGQLAAGTMCPDIGYSFLERTRNLSGTARRGQISG
jgi:hypothetical protein